MKTAQEVRVGNVIVIDGDPMVVLKSEYNISKSGRRQNAAIVKMKMKNLLTDNAAEKIYQATDKFDLVVLEKKEVTYSYFSDPNYIFMDSDFNQYEIDQDAMDGTLKFLEDGMACEIVFYEQRPISVELPNSVVREITLYRASCEGRHNFR